MNLGKQVFVIPAVATLLLAMTAIAEAESIQFRSANRAMFQDVSLQDNGTFVGVFVQSDGTPLNGQKVLVRQQGKLVAATTTDVQGRFQVENLRGGVYEVATAEGAVTMRVWTPEVAPPSARSSALLVSNQNKNVGGKSASPNGVEASVASAKSSNEFGLVRGQNQPGGPNIPGAGAPGLNVPGGGQTMLFNPNSVGAQLFQVVTPVASIGGTVLTVTETQNLQEQITMMQAGTP